MIFEKFLFNILLLNLKKWNDSRIFYFKKGAFIFESNIECSKLRNEIKNRSLDPVYLILWFGKQPKSGLLKQFFPDSLGLVLN